MSKRLSAVPGKFANGAVTGAMSYAFGSLASRGGSSDGSGLHDPTDAEMVAYLENSGFWDSERMLAQEDTWRLIQIMGGPGDFSVRTGRNLRIDMTTDALGIDGAHVLAGSYPLDRSGRHVQTVGPDELRPAFGVSGHVGTMGSRSTILDAGYDSPGGFEWHVKVPRQPGPHGTSAIRVWIYEKKP